MEIKNSIVSSLSICDIKRNITDIEQQDVSKILTYLKNGKMVYGELGVFYDCFDNVEIRGPLYFTDGVWLWDNALIHYIEKYNYRVSDELLCQIKNNDWTVPNKVEIPDEISFPISQRKLKGLK